MMSVRRGCRGVVMMVTAWAVVAAGVGVAGAAGRVAASPGSGWGNGIEVPGSGALNVGGNAGVGQVSCSSPGNCAVGGFYTDRSKHRQATVASEVSGRWGRAEEVPGTAALNRGGFAQVVSVSCVPKGECTAAGLYDDRSNHIQLFVVSQAKGRWGQAEEIPGLGQLNAGGFAEMDGLACPSPGNCLAAGTYTTRRSSLQAFVVSEAHGRWGRAVRLSGAGLRASDYATIRGVECTSAGNCAVGGGDRPHGLIQPIVVSEHNGVWGPGTVISVPASFNTGSILIDALTCASAGNCAAGGAYSVIGNDHIVSYEAFVVDERGGVWGPAQEAPGTAALNEFGGLADVQAMSCGAPGTCVAGGGYTNKAGFPAFLADETGGTWGKAFPVPGLASLNTGNAARVEWVTCPSAGNCVAAGYYLTHNLHSHLFVISQTAGTWGKAIEVPGLAALDAGRDAGRDISVSCPVAGGCTLATSYTDHKGHTQMFVDWQK